MKAKKRILALALALILCAAVATPALAAGGKKLDVKWFNETVGDHNVVDASYVKEFGIFSLLLIGDEGYSVMNIDVATGRRTDKYGDYFIYPFKEGRAMIGVAGENVDIDAYGFMDTSGKVILEPVYYDATPFYDGYAAVHSNSEKTGYKDGYIDTNGNPMYTDELWLAMPFENGAALVHSSNDGYAVLDTKFNYLVKPGKYNYIEPFNDGIAAVRNDSMKYGAIDSTGKEVIPCEYDSMSLCYDGLIAVGKRDETKALKYGYVDKSGKTVIPIKYDSAGDFNGGHALVSEGDTVRVIDKTGNTVGTFSRKEYDYGYSSWISEDRIRAYTVVNNEPLVTLLDLTGKEIMPRIASTRMMEFNSGLALVYGDEGHIYVDRDGNRVIEPNDFDDVCLAYSSGDLLDDSYGTYVAVLKDGKLGYFVNPYSDEAATPDTPDTPTAPALTDVPEWCAEAAEYMAEHNLMNGTGAGKFSPNVTTTRGMLMTILARADGVDTAGDPWYKAGMEWCVGAKVSDGTRPEATVTRQEIATMLWRYFDEPACDKTPDFPDVSSVESYAVTAVNWCVDNGIINGNNGLLDPKGPATRAQAATMVYRALTKFAS